MRFILIIIKSSKIHMKRKKNLTFREFAGKIADKEVIISSFGNNFK